jgi:hypothetical protein
MSVPNTQEKWWILFEDNIDNILACANKTNVDVTENDLVKWNEEEDDDAAYCILDKIWEAAPDDPVIHTWPGWNNICNLCSEYDALFLEEEETVESDTEDDTDDEDDVL